MNLFFIFDVAMDFGIRKVMGGVVLFIICDIVRVILLVAFPILATWLPSTMR